MDISSLRSQISTKAKKLKPASKKDPKRITSSEQGVQTTDKTSKMTGWEVLWKGIPFLKKALLMIGIIIFTAVTWRYIGWESTVAVYTGLLVFYLVFRYVIEIPLVLVLEYDYETKEMQLYGVPQGKWHEINKQGVAAYVRCNGRPIYIAKDLDLSSESINFAYIHDQTFLDFWEDDQVFGIISEKVQELQERYTESINTAQITGYNKAREYMQDLMDLNDQVLRGEDLDKKYSDIPREPPSKQKIRGGAEAES